MYRYDEINKYCILKTELHNVIEILNKFGQHVYFFSYLILLQALRETSHVESRMQHLRVI